MEIRAEIIEERGEYVPNEEDKKTEDSTCYFCSKVIDNAVVTYEGKSFHPGECLSKHIEKEIGEKQGNQNQHNSNNNTHQTNQLPQAQIKAITEITAIL